MRELLWKYIDSWSTEPGREWLGEETDPNARRGQYKSAAQKPPVMQKYTVTFQVPPLRAAPTGQFLRQSAKDAGAEAGDEYGLPSDLDLVNTAAENAELFDTLGDIGDICIEHFVVRGNYTKEYYQSSYEELRAAMDNIQKLVAKAFKAQGAGSGAKVLDRMRQQREAIQEKSADVAAELLRRMDDDEPDHTDPP